MKDVPESKSLKIAQFPKHILLEIKPYIKINIHSSTGKMIPARVSRPFSEYILSQVVRQ